MESGTVSNVASRPGALQLGRPPEAALSAQPVINPGVIG